MLLLCNAKHYLGIRSKKTKTDLFRQIDFLNYIFYSFRLRRSLEVFFFRRLKRQTGFLFERSLFLIHFYILLNVLKYFFFNENASCNLVNFLENH